ncbi:hypothetical protein Pcinc_040385 [Petrolisthes cinctipes]|uniref:Uncharacterized protein n=1 Tax=Petrolisthes cinctipes TaxID=88211 RepID=A0AAE1BQE5_PETCI|nr:hypothetical protein Pcinc_040385 [Petrolisthes cinctipes]
MGLVGYGTVGTGGEQSVRGKVMRKKPASQRQADRGIEVVGWDGRQAEGRVWKCRTNPRSGNDNVNVQVLLQRL